MIGILHISDLHFGRLEGELFSARDELLDSIVRAVAPRWRQVTQPFLVVSGDLVWQGAVSAFDIARKFLLALCSALEIPARQVIMCPGNHDITAGADAFKLFNQVAHVVSADTARLFSSRAPIWVQHIGGVTFLALNSAHHADHTYGLIDLNTLNGIEIPSASGPRIAVIHHNLVGIHPRDTSTVRNAYAFLHRVVTDRFDVVLHGHQHSMQLLRVGDAHIVGAGSLNLAPLRGLPNQFNLLIWTPRLRIERYSFSHDGSSKGRIGGWHGTTLFPSRG